MLQQLLLTNVGIEMVAHNGRWDGEELIQQMLIYKQISFTTPYILA